MTKVISRYEEPPLAPGEIRLFELAWMRLGSHNPEGMPWKHPKRDHALSMPRTRAEFLTYIEVVSRFMSGRMVELQRALQDRSKLQSDLQRALNETSMWRRRSEEIQKRAEEELRAAHQNQDYLSGKLQLAEKDKSLFDALIEKFGEEHLRDLANGNNNNKVGGGKRKIRL